MSTSTVSIDGVEHVLVARMSPAQARGAALDAVLGALDAAGVPAFVVRTGLPSPAVVGVRADHRAAAVRALAAGLPGAGARLREVYPTAQPQQSAVLTERRMLEVPARCPVIGVATQWAVAGTPVTFGLDHGCEIEFWERSSEDPALWLAPRVNVAAQTVHEDYLAPATITVDGVSRPSVELFDRSFLADVRFPVDVVYTWVDGADPAWRERFRRARAEADGVDYHPEAHAANRYESRDELRYSLRSLEWFAPWVRHVWLVTDGQTPSWLDTSHERITVVDHRDIYRDPGVLPVFNSSAIITQLHHIDGLSEHYLYMNDDMFFGAEVVPEDFWFGSGVAKVFPSRQTRPFGPAHHFDAPHFNISKNIRTLMESELGRSMSLAIRHTPYPQVRSVLAEMEERFADVLDATAGHRFRHHDDVAADQFFHYYAQATGRAVPSTIGYDYVNVGVVSDLYRLRRLLAARDRKVFCLNDAPEDGVAPIAGSEVQAFLQAYFPVPSRFETVP